MPLTAAREIAGRLVPAVTFGGWRAEAQHVVPEDDLREHTLTPDCWCRPRDEDGVVIHNSLDRRELFERGERRLT